MRPPDLPWEELLRTVQAMLEPSAAQGFDAAAWLEAWLQEPVPALGHATPASLLGRPGGLELVCDVLRRMKSGAYC